MISGAPLCDIGSESEGHASKYSRDCLRRGYIFVPRLIERRTLTPTPPAGRSGPPDCLQEVGIPAVSRCPVGRTAAVDCARLGLTGAHAKNQDPRNLAPARAPVFPSSILGKMSLATSGRLFGMRPLLRLGASIGDTFERNSATCQQLADEGTQNDPMRVETPLNWPVENSCWQLRGWYARAANTGPECGMEEGRKGCCDQPRLADQKPAA